MNVEHDSMKKGLVYSKLINELNLDSKLPIALVFGGSQGAKAINNSLIQIITGGLNKKYQIIWACGPKQYDVIKEELLSKKIEIEQIKKTKIVPYIYNMEEVMMISDVIVSRSGAMTIAEVSTLRKASNIHSVSICDRKSSGIQCKSIRKSRSCKNTTRKRFKPESLGGNNRYHVSGRR